MVGDQGSSGGVGDRDPACLCRVFAGWVAWAGASGGGSGQREGDGGRREGGSAGGFWRRLSGSVGQGAGRSEVGEELEAEADHEVPDVARHLRPGNEHPPDDHHQQRVERVADVSQSATITALFQFHAFAF